MTSDAELSAARKRGDPVADTVIEQLGREVWAMNAVMRGCRGNEQPLPLSLPPAAHGFFDRQSRLPTWANRTRLLAAQRWAMEHLLHITAVLFHASLPSAYAAEAGAQVLLATGRMTTDVDRRVNETARFVIDVLELGSFETSGLAIRAAQQVRLVHAAVRRELRTRAPESDEVPLNQEDLLGTLLTFSVVIVRGVRRLGVPVSAATADDFFHLWRVVGALMGIEEALLPADFAAAEAVTERIANRHFRVSAAGRSLMATLLSRINEHVFFPGITNYLVRRLAGDHVADLLGVPTGASFRFAFNQLARLPFANRLPVHALLPQITPLVGQSLLNSIISRKLGREHPGFETPTFVNDSFLID